jgi:pyrroline-5-carboxylate reductase
MNDSQRQPLAGFTGRLTIFGCGTMAGAMLSRWLACGLPPAQVTAIRASGVEAAPGVTTLTNIDGQRSPDILLIGIKPLQLAALETDIAALAGPNSLVVSILAGVPMGRLASGLPHAGAIVRLMPNMPVAHGRGIVARLGDAGPQAATLDALLAPLGHIQTVTDEKAFDLVTALAGCGPAFTYRFAAALAAAGERLGLAQADAITLARLTVAGAAETIIASDTPLASLADAVASSGGMTQAGLDVLDADGILVQLLTQTLRAARDRGSELAALVDQQVGGR